MRFDPTLDTPLVDSYPALAVRNKYFPDDEALRFYIYLIAPDSPLSLERDWDIRIDEALRLTGMDRNAVAFLDFEEGAEHTQDAIFELFRLYSHLEYEAWWALKQSFHIVTASLRDSYGLKATDRLRAMQNMKAILNQLVEVEYSLFKEDHIRDIVAERAAAQSLSGYAEKHAQELA